ncbi:GNAT family N-acetyltransferase [Algisphaera agarilytica]|uniref:Ribosomal protein S18 acetylase RimI-like enzyme n=1 Tax=Algisphaera agarilytica TaxID=1385975 RepID=A0A7X0H2Y7_9BACT|nr:N-acetyltransferase [Algisphaera agarilytica]MBB6428255.1 ribosomal protein S18 acetylase RimI-like enzyme [Algisphaera agarilytica]
MPQDPAYPELLVREADLTDARDAKSVVEMVAMYATDPLAGGVTLPDEVRERLPEALHNTPGCVVFLAYADDSHDAAPLGVAVCFEGLSTFRAQPKLNLHDLAVSPEARGRGVGRALMAAVLAEARQRGCCYATLEVHADNAVAKGLYASSGFEPGYEFWSCELSS